MRGKASSTQVVRNEGIYHGLPTYPDDVKGLTAIVTGANGISGYHMVKVLSAAPARWSKIYCLSRRPPPDYFYEGLGEGASRVEHVSADFLGDVGKLGEQLKAIKHVDYVFFFSYTQPKQDAQVLSMWSDADALAKVNTELISNFMEGLKSANLMPKRFLLQTGAKHYGFHIGPATSPSFESDPRITLENNFYYPHAYPPLPSSPLITNLNHRQEDALFAYSKSTGAGWNVVRPSYIIGAVRDNQLNYMFGFAVYAAVSAHLKQPLKFPGDYLAWDKEFCESSAVMNSYLSEWAVLTDHCVNEAFNAQDGLAFTWSRFWPYLAHWFGTTWEPPSADPSAYTRYESRWSDCPRGYGPRGATSVTFTLREWSERKDVVAAWEELKKTHGLMFDPFQDRDQVFGITDSAVIGSWPLSLSMRKARRLGFHGTVDSYEAMFHTLVELNQIKVAPPMAVKEFLEDV